MSQWNKQQPGELPLAIDVFFCALTCHLDQTVGQMDAFRALQLRLIESGRETLSNNFPTRETTLYADRQHRLIAVETLLLSPRFSTCNEEEVAAFMSVLAGLTIDQMQEMQELVAGCQTMPSNVDLASHGDSPASSITHSSNQPFPRRNSHPAEVALMEGLLFDGLVDEDGRVIMGLPSDTALNQDGRVNTDGNASIDATHGSASVTEPSSSFSATEPSFGNLDL